MQTHNITMHHHNNDHNKNNITTTTTTTKGKKKNISSLIPTNAAAIPQPRTHASAAQACAACKYRRRKCTTDCTLAPYFPHDRQPQFLNAHRLFGVSNIVKIVRHLTPSERDLAMRTIIFESDARAADPVGGCYRIIRDLEQRISLARAELEIVLHRLAVCRAAAAAQRQVVVPPPPDGGDSYGEKWREGYVVEDEVAAVDDVDSWGCMDENFHAHCILDHLACDDDFREEEFKIDSNGNIIPSSNGSLTERDTFKEDEDCSSYIQDQDLKAAAKFINLTN